MACRQRCLPRGPPGRGCTAARRTRGWRLRQRVVNGGVDVEVEPVAQTSVEEELAAEKEALPFVVVAVVGDVGS